MYEFCINGIPETYSDMVPNVCLFLFKGSVFVMMSRLYLGVHSPADIVVGGIIGCIVLAIWMKTDDLFDMAISYGTNGK